MGGYARYGALDGLRGVAALVVVVHHGLLTSASLASAYISDGEASSWPRLLTYTPMHIIWAGKESVIVFFVLSGLVLTLPRLREKPESWRAYYPKRLLRLYVPIAAAVVLSVGIVAVVGRTGNNASWWMNTHTGPSLSQFLHDVTLIDGHGAVNTALWSLQWEVWFSILLPAYLWLCTAIRWMGFLPGLMIVATATIIGWQIESPITMFMPVFGAGVLVAVHRDQLRATSVRVFRGPGQGWKAATGVTVSVVALTAEWWTLGLGVGRSVANVFGATGVLFGATLLVLLAMYSEAFGKALQVAPIRWLGKRSFSLYLIHEPIVVSVGELLPNRGNPILVTVIGMAISLVCAEVFCRAVEQPSHRLARWVGESVTAKLGRAGPG